MCPKLQDRLAFKAFGKESILTMGADHFETDWEQQWRTRLADLDHGSSTGGLPGVRGDTTRCYSCACCSAMLQITVMLQYTSSVCEVGLLMGRALLQPEVHGTASRTGLCCPDSRYFSPAQSSRMWFSHPQSAAAQNSNNVVSARRTHHRACMLLVADGHQKSLWLCRR